MQIKTLALLAAIVTIPAAISAAQADTMPSADTKSSYKDTANGGMEQSTKTTATDANGTEMTHSASKSVDVDSKGNTTSTVDIKDTKDPKGLMNKSTTEIKNKSVSKDGKTETKHVKTVNGTTVEKTDTVDQQ